MRQRDPGSRLLGSQDVSRSVRGGTGGGRWTGGQQPLRLIPKASYGVERGVYRATEEPHRSTGGRGAKARQGLSPNSRSLGSPCLNFPETEDRVYYPVPEGPEFGFRLYPGERVLLMLQECGKL